jgi:protease-4
MDYDNTGNVQPPPPSPYSMPQYMPPVPPERKGSVLKVFWAIVTAFSVLANVGMFFLIIGMLVFFAAGREKQFVEKVIEEGPRTSRIAVISINGVINEERASEVFWQIKTATEDSTVKGLIIRVNSPGGTLSGSDQIHNEIVKYRTEKHKPAVAFMQGVAASGGYYSSVACEKIIAEPTTITGSIGVIMEYLVLQQLLEDKLGIMPVVVKAGAKKDWPSPFKVPTDEEKQYMQERIITPAYEQFIKVVVDGRKMLAEDEIRKLADGSIYWAEQAVDNKLIDKIGYLKDAIKEVKDEAKIEKAQVIEYQRPFSLSEIFSTKTRAALKIDRNTVYELSIPQVLYLWTGTQ